jgi:alpha-beta hydrolase superfamily lysophospholipase
MSNAAPADAAPTRDKLLAAQWRAMTPARMADYGVLADDIERMRHMTSSGLTWDAAAEALANAQLQRAELAGEHGHYVTALEAYRAAAADLIFAQMAFNFDTDRKHELYGHLTSVLSTVSTLPNGNLDRVDAPFGDKVLSGWLVRPPGGVAKATVIVFGGQSGWGTAYWRHADALADRGIATILAEGPGQGETRLRHGVFLDVDVPAAYGAFVDHIERDPTLGTSVGIFGNSLGGLYAALTAAADSRIMACCINGAPAAPKLLGARSFDEQAAAMLGTDDKDAITANFSRLTFDPESTQIRCPLLVLHGGADVLFDLAAQQPFLDGAGEDKTLRIWPDGDHTIYNHCHERTAYVADWFVERLTRHE